MENAFYSHCKALLAGIGKTVAASSKSMFLNFKMFRTLYVKKMIHLTPPWRMPSTHPWNRLSFEIMKDDSLRGFSRTADFFLMVAKIKRIIQKIEYWLPEPGSFAECATGEQRQKQESRGGQVCLGSVISPGEQPSISPFSCGILTQWRAPARSRNRKRSFPGLFMTKHS